MPERAWWESKTLLFGLLALAIIGLMFIVALAVYLLTDKSLPFLGDFLQAILGVFGINTARNVVTDGIMRRTGNAVGSAPASTPSFIPPHA